jgi:arginine deiminase
VSARRGSGANLVRASPGVVFAYDRNAHANALLREAGIEVIPSRVPSPVAGGAGATA